MATTLENNIPEITRGVVVKHGFSSAKLHVTLPGGKLVRLVANYGEGIERLNNLDLVEVKTPKTPESLSTITQILFSATRT